jgi:hypothetical protein
MVSAAPGARSPLATKVFKKSGEAIRGDAESVCEVVRGLLNLRDELQASTGDQ